MKVWKNVPKASWLVVIFIWTVFVLTGCGLKRPYVEEFSAIRPADQPKIAVLPFVNRSVFRQGEKILYRLFLVGLVQQCNWHVALEGDVFKVYRQMRLKPWDVPDVEQLRLIAVRLGVDTLIVGEVLEMDENVTQSIVNPSLSILVRVYDGRTGFMKWSSLYHRKGEDYQKMMHFGMINTVSELGERMVREMFEAWKEKGLLVCVGS